MDHGSLGEDAVRRSGPIVALNHHSHARSHSRSHSHSHSHTHHFRSRSSSRDDDTPPALGCSPDSIDDPKLQKIPIDAYAAANLHAFQANVRATDASNDPDDDPVDPADFYRSYREGAQPGHVAAPSLTDPMTADLPASPQLSASAANTTSPRRPTSSRSNGTGAPLKGPQATTALPQRGIPQPSQRSVSNPAESRIPTPSASATSTRPPLTVSHVPSVKDLKKRFDQSAPSSQSTDPVRKSTPRSRDPSLNGRLTSAGTGATPHGAPTTSSGTRDTPREPTKTSHTGPRYLAGDPSHNISQQSFASRIARPRAGASKPPNDPGSRTLLFGEILPEQSGSATPGFGIESVTRPRRTSDSSIQNPTRYQMRSRSDPDVEPPSPSDWYRTVDSSQQHGFDHAATSLSKNHSRARSDLAGSKLPLPPIRADIAVSKRDTDSPVSPISSTSQTSTASRLPRLAKRMNASSSHASPVSSRSSSPSAFRYSTGAGRSSRQPAQSTASRSKTPTTSSSSQVKTPSQTPTSSARKAPPPSTTTSSASRLNAYVAVPPPKLSPPLRSSRPRQSVASATTAASRMRAVERTPAPKQEEPTPRRRKISVGAIDFAQRRETIKLAYSKSLRETQALEARKAAAEKRKKELETVAKTKVEAEAAVVAALANSTATALAAPVLPRKTSSRRPSSATDPSARSILTSARPGSEPREPEAAEAGQLPAESASGPAETAAESLPRIELPVSRELTPTEDSGLPEASVVLQEPHNEPLNYRPSSLRLEIPGAFPDAELVPSSRDDMPISAVSDTSAITEFDTEVQTEPPRQESGPVAGASLDEIPPALSQSAAEPKVTGQSPHEQQPHSSIQHDQKSASYRPSPENEPQEDDCVSIKISLDTSAIPDAQPRPSSQPAPARPSAYMPYPADEDDDEYVPRPYIPPADSYKTTVTILGPDHDFKPLHKDQPRETTPLAGLRQADELSAAAAASEPGSRGASRLDESRFEKGSPDLEGLERIEDFYIGPRLRDNVAALRDSTFTSSGSGTNTPLDVHHSSSSSQYPEPSGINTSLGLTVPSLLAPGNRQSHHSAWTDFSIGSEEPDGGRPFSAAASHDDYLTSEGGVIRVRPSVGDLSTCASSFGELTQSPEISSSLDRSRAPSPPMLPELPPSRQLSLEPESADILTARSEPGSTRTSSVSRPPIPERSSSVRTCDQESRTLYLSESRPHSYAHSHDGLQPAGGTNTNTMSPPASVSRLQLDSAAGSRDSLGESTLAEQQSAPLTEEEQAEQKRLRQRQLVIRELIDTEETFVRDMTVVEEIYKGTAEACPNLDSKTIKLIFRNTDEIIAFHTALLAEFKEGASTVYTPPKARRSPQLAPNAPDSDSSAAAPTASSSKVQHDDEKDRLTSLGPIFTRNIDQLKAVHETYLRTSDAAAKRLLQIQEDKTVMVWLNECNVVAKELTTAWNLDSLLIKPMQRITKYPDIITHLLKYTPDNHPDRESLIQARTAVIDAIDEINKSKKNFELVGQIVSNKKRKESSDVRLGLARAFGKRVDKLQGTGSKTAEDEEYQRLQQQFSDDFLRLQVVLRDVEFYTRSVSTYVHEFLQYLSSIELVMRLQPSRDYAHIESKWVQFNVSMRDIEKVALEKHLADVRKHVIEPFEQVIRCYTNPSLAMKKRAKRRLDYERYMQLKANGKKIDRQLAELVEQYEALNDTLKKELPKLSALTARVGNICLGKFICIQASWFAMWKEKVKMPLQELGDHVPEPAEIVSAFQREFSIQEERAMSLGILNPALKTRTSQSTTDEASSVLSRTRSRPSDLGSTRTRGLSVNSDNNAPTLPTPDFGKRNSGQFTLSPASSGLPSPANYYRDFYPGINNTSSPQLRGGSGSPVTSSDPYATTTITTTTTNNNNNNNNNGSAASSSASFSSRQPQQRPSTGRSLDSTGMPRQSSDSTALYSAYMHQTPRSRRGSNSTFNSNIVAATETRRHSGLFQSALPPPDTPGATSAAEEFFFRSGVSSRASSPAGERGGSQHKVLWLAASLFEFNIETTKYEAGYPYLTYQAGEVSFPFVPFK